MRLVALLLVGLALAPPVVADAADCRRDPLATVGGREHPVPGVYATLGCGAAQGHPVVRLELAPSEGEEAPCAFVPAVFVLRQHVPLTGETYCAGAEPVVVESPWNRDVPDRGVAACGGSAWCREASTGDAVAACEALGPVAVPLPGGGEALVSCHVRRA